MVKLNDAVRFQSSTDLSLTGGDGPKTCACCGNGSLPCCGSASDNMIQEEIVRAPILSIADFLALQARARQPHQFLTAQIVERAGTPLAPTPAPDDPSLSVG